MKKLIGIGVVVLVTAMWLISGPRLAKAALSSANLQVNSSSDDVNQDGTTLTTNASTIWVGNGSSASSSYTGLRFNNVNIPPGSTISSAQLQFYSSQSQWISVAVKISGDAAVNSSTFSTSSLPSQKSLTTAFVNLSTNVKWNSATWYALADVSPVVQEIVNKAGWKSGNSLSLIVKGTGGAWSRKFANSFEGGATKAPQLLITYQNSTPTPTPIPPTPTPTSVPLPTPTPLPLPTPTGGPVPTPTPTLAPLPTATPTPLPLPTPIPPTPTPTSVPLPTPTSMPTPTPVPSSIVTFTAGNGGSDVVPHQLIRTSDDRLYFFGYAGDTSTTLEAFWTTTPGLPNSTADFGGSMTKTYPATITSVAPVYDGANIVHVLTNTADGKLTDVPFDVTTNSFKLAEVLDTGLPTSFINAGTSGLTGGMSGNGTLQIAYWSAGNHITYRSYSYDKVGDVLTLATGPTILDGAESSNNNHPVLAISPLNGTVTVAWVSGSNGAGNIWSRTTDNSGVWLPAVQVNNSPVWTSPNSGLNIDQGPALVIDNSGVRYLTYIENYRMTSPFDYGRIHYVVNSGLGWNDTYVGFYTHDPAVALDNLGNVYIVGHGYPLNPTPCTSVDDMCLYPRSANGTWGPPQLVAAHTGTNSFDVSSSIKWSTVGLNRPDTVEFVFPEIVNGTYSNTVMHYARINPPVITPTATPTLVPTATPTPLPLPTPTPTPLPLPTPTDVPVPTPTSIPLPTPTDVPVPTPGVVLGNQAVLTNVDGNTAGTAEAFSALAGGSGTVSNLSVYLDSTSTANSVIFGIYTDSAGNPGALLAQATLTNPVAGAWNSVILPSNTITSGSTYWLAILGPVGSGNVQFRDSGSGTKSQVSLQTNLTSLPASWTSGASYSNSPISGYLY